MKHISCLLLTLCFISVVQAQKFAIISDIHGATTDTYEVSLLVKSWEPEFIITAGDNHYGTYSTIDNQVGQFYSDFIYPYTGAFGTGDTVNRFFPSLGNHDYDSTGFFYYLQYFQLPGNERYYDFVRGNVHFFAVNCNYAEPDGNTATSLQADWLRSRLAASTSHFNVVYFHFPPYSSSHHGSTPFMQWPFKQWGASIVFSGHDHNYERLLVDSFPYIVCGLGGGPLYNVYDSLPGSLFHNCSYHGALLANANADSLVFEFRTSFDSLIESYTIYKLLHTPNLDGGYSLIDAQLFQNYPNPASDATTIKFSLPHQGSVVLNLYNLYGQIIQKYTGNFLSAGFHQIDWNTNTLDQGVYFFSLQFENKTFNIKTMVLHH